MEYIMYFDSDDNIVMLFTLITRAALVKLIWTQK